MEYRILGRTKLKVSAIGLGGGPFLSNEVQPSVIKDIIEIGYKKGINLIETGEEYDESKIGIALSEVKDAKFQIVTKSTAFDRKEMHKAVNQSLLKLKRDQIELYQLHSVNTLEDLNLRLNGGVLKALKKEQKDGRINFIGITGHYIPALVEAVKTNEFDAVQVPYNMTHPLAEELFDLCKKYDTGIIVMKPLGGGFLVDPKIEWETPNEGAENMTAENALKFVLSNKRVHTVLIGMREVKQVEENIKICNQNLNLSEEQRSFLTKRAKNFLGDDYCRNCKYCMPCAVHGWSFEIDTYLRFYSFYEKYGYNQFKEEYSKLKMKADACTGCGECEKKCPYHLPIRAMLKKAHLHLNLQNLEEELEGEKKGQLIGLIKDFRKEAIRSGKDIKRLWYSIGEKEQVLQRSREELERREHEIQELRKEMDKKQRVQEEMIKKMDELRMNEKKLLALEELYNQQRKELNSVYQSKAYRYIVSPLRKTSNKIPKKQHEKN